MKNQTFNYHCNKILSIANYQYNDAVKRYSEYWFSSDNDGKDMFTEEFKYIMNHHVKNYSKSHKLKINFYYDDKKNITLKVSNFFHSFETKLNIKNLERYIKIRKLKYI